MGVAAHRSSFVHFKHRNVPDRALVRDLRRVARKTGRRRVTAALYAEHGAFRPNTLARRFGSWNAALGAAGLKVTQHWNVPDAALLKNLADVWRKLGRQPTWRELTKRGGFSTFAGATYKRRFGSWHGALRAFEVFANKRGRPAPLPRRAKTTARTSREINWRLRATVLIRDNCLCRMCGASPAKDPAVALHVDHIVPWAKGGHTVLANLQTLCATCNIGKGDQPLVRADDGRRSAGRRKWRRDDRVAQRRCARIGLQLAEKRNH
jgi:5-methylcytosine-specific restriction endonuclease McrA